MSVVTYQQEKKELQVGGEVQGKADVTVLYILNSSILLDSHNVIAPGLCLQSCTRARTIKHNKVAYSDHMDGHVSAPTEMVVEDMRKVRKFGTT